MTASPKTWAIVGASRGIGNEFVRQLLDQGHDVIATARKSTLDNIKSRWQGRKCQVYECDMLDENAITSFAQAVKASGVQRLDYVVLNAGVLQYPVRATELSYTSYLTHLQTNTIGPILTAQSLLRTRIPIGTLIFISSDSGSASKFRPEEDGFAAYASSKAALNQMLRHMAAELTRQGSETVVLALHPGEVATEMADVELGWTVEGQMSVEESVEKCIGVIEREGGGETGRFLTWEGKEYPW